jgi:lysozyme family protein
MTPYEVAFADVIGVEGGYTDDPHDPGNWTGGVVGKGTCRGTKYGISAAAYPTLDIQAITLAQAQAIYRHDYWDKLLAGSLPVAAARLAFDAAVNQGLPTTIRLLQAAAGAEQDGVLGPVTLAALQAMPPASLFIEFEARRALRYAQSASLGIYGLGWYRRLCGVAYRAATSS